MISLVHGERARTRDLNIARVEHLSSGVETHDRAALPVGDEDIAGGVDGRPLRLDQDRRSAVLRCTPGEELGAPVGQPIESADAAIAIERGHQDLPTVAAATHLGIDQGRAVEVARLG